MQKKDIQLQFESVEAGIFSEEEVNDILENLAALLISSWEKKNTPSDSKNKKEFSST